MSDLRDPRAFKVLGGDPSFPKDDAVLIAQAKGDRPQGYAAETYRTGQRIPGGRVPLSSAGWMISNGYIEVIELKTAPAPALAPSPAVPMSRSTVAPATATKPAARVGGDA